MGQSSTGLRQGAYSGYCGQPGQTATLVVARPTLRPRPPQAGCSPEGIALYSPGGLLESLIIRPSAPDVTCTSGAGEWCVSIREILLKARGRDFALTKNVAWIGPNAMGIYPRGIIPRPILRPGWVPRHIQTSVGRTCEAGSAGMMNTEGGTRTHTPQGEPDFESGASANSATSAWIPVEPGVDGASSRSDRPSST